MRTVQLLFVAALALLLSVGGQSSAESAAGATYQAVREEVSDFIGPLRGDYIASDASVAEQIDEALAGPGETLDVGRGRRLITGFRPHSAQERAAVLLDDHGRILAVGLKSYRCRRDSGCEGDPTLTIFAPFASLDRSLLEPLLRWSGSERPAYNAPSGLIGPTPFGGVEFEFRSTR